MCGRGQNRHGLIAAATDGEGMYRGDHARKIQLKALPALGKALSFAAAVAICSSCVLPNAVHAYAIPSSSMAGTIHEGDRVYSENISYLFSEPAAGDIVTFADPTLEQRTLIKRVIATAGQTVDLRFGTVYVDGVALEEPYVDGQESYPLMSAYGVDVTYPYTVPEGHVWVMGDNRSDSLDSRYFGAVPVSSISGKAVLTYWPLPRIGLLDA